MPKPGETVHVVVQVTSGGAAVTGLTSAAFAVAAWVAGAAQTISFATADLGGGFYSVSMVMGTALGWANVIVSSTGRTVTGGRLYGKVTPHDSEDIYSNTVRPVVSLTNSNVLGDDISLELVANRERPLTFNVRDQSDNPVDLSGYSNWRFSVWDLRHTSGQRYTLASGITGTSLGVISFTVPEAASFYTFVDPVIAAGESQTTLYWDVIADAGGVSASTRCILRGPLTLKRYEGAA